MTLLSWFARVGTACWPCTLISNNRPPSTYISLLPLAPFSTAVDDHDDDSPQGPNDGDDANTACRTL